MISFEENCVLLTLTGLCLLVFGVLHMYVCMIFFSYFTYVCIYVHIIVHMYNFILPLAVFTFSFVSFILLIDVLFVSTHMYVNMYV